MKQEYDNWLEEMIDRESIPRSARNETVEAFCKRWGISEPTYYYQSSKTENQKKILKITLQSAKKEAPEVLKVLIEKSKKGDMKAVDMYLNYILKLAKQFDLTSDEKPLPIISLTSLINDISKDTITSKDSEPKKKD